MIQLEKYNSLLDFKKALSREKKGTIGEVFDPDFVGVENEEKANELFSYGDQKTVRLIQNCSKKVAKKTTTKIYNAPNGFAPNIGAVMTGHPYNMINIKSTIVKTKVINLVYFIAAPFYITAEELASAGAKVLNIVYTLENQGYKVNLYAACAAKPTLKFITKNKVIATGVKIKDSGKQLNISKIAYPIANPAFFRYHIFRWVNTMDNLDNCATIRDEKILQDVANKLCKGAKYLTATNMNQPESELIKKILN